MIRLIVAIDQKQGIGKKGFQPWYIPEDDAYFSRQTKLYGANVLVGSKTFKIFTGPLAGRTNYVLTRGSDIFEGEGVVAVNDIDVFLEKFKGKDIWVIGGASLFEQVMKSGKAGELYITHIVADFGCVQFFPEYKDRFALREQSDWHEQNGFKFSYAIYDKLK